MHPSALRRDCLSGDSGRCLSRRYLVECNHIRWLIANGLYVSNTAAYHIPRNTEHSPSDVCSVHSFLAQNRLPVCQWSGVPSLVQSFVSAW